MTVAMHQTLGLRSSESTEIEPAKLSKKGQTTRAGRRRLLNRASLDGRLIVAKVFDRLVAAIHADLGGRDQLSAIELALVEAFAGTAVTLDNLNTRLLLGQPINLAEQAQAVSAMVRVASRLGTGRRLRNVTPSLTEILSEDGDG